MCKPGVVGHNKAGGQHRDGCFPHAVGVRVDYKFHKFCGPLLMKLNKLFCKIGSRAPPVLSVTAGRLFGKKTPERVLQRRVVSRRRQRILPEGFSKLERNGKNLRDWAVCFVGWVMGGDV